MLHVMIKYAPFNEDTIQEEGREFTAVRSYSFQLRSSLGAVSLSGVLLCDGKYHRIIFFLSVRASLLSQLRVHCLQGPSYDHGEKTARC